MYRNFIKRVTGGEAGEVFLIDDGSVTAVFDTGLAYCADEMIKNLKKELKGRPLDYVFLSHTHYDHAGGVPYLRREWRDLDVIGSEHGKMILERESALETIRNMSENAALGYTELNLKRPYKNEDMKITRIVHDGDTIIMKNKTVRVIETKGHTNCCLSYYIEEEGILLASESTGYMTANGNVRVPFLSSYLDTITSINKCKSMSPEWVLISHNKDGLIRGSSELWDNALEKASEEKDYILTKLRDGESHEKIIKDAQKVIWKSEEISSQPLLAFQINMVARIKTIEREFVI